MTDGSDQAGLTLFGQYVLAGFSKQQDSGTGTLITYTPPAQPALAAAHR